MSRPARLFIIASFAIAFGLSALVLTHQPSVGPQPPTLPDPSSVDPAIADLVSEALTKIKSSPRDPALRLTLALIYHANGLPTLAQAAYKQALLLDQSNPKSWHHLAQVQADLGDLEAAVTSIDRSISIEPSYAPSHWQRGFWLLDLGQVDDAAASFTAARQLEPGSPPAIVGLARVHIHRTEHQSAIALLSELIRARGLSTPHLAYIHQLLGTAQRASGHPAAAGHLAASGNPDALPGPRERPVKWPGEWSAELVNYVVGRRANLDQLEYLIATAQFDRAMTRANDLLQREPSDTALLNWLAIAQLSSNQTDQGIATLRRAIDADPNHYATHLNLAEALQSKADLANALAHAQRAADLNPGSGRAHLAVGRILLLESQPERAVPSLTRAIECGANSTQVRVLLGQTLIDLRRFPQAVKVLEQAVRSDHQAAEAFAALALARTETGQLPGARLALQRAMQLNPSLPTLNQTAARIAQLEGSRPAPNPSPRP